MSKLLRLIQAVLMISVSAVAAGQAPPNAPAKPAPRPLYTYRAEMVPMRDGVHLQTVIMVPLDARGPLPILLRRTPYGVPEKPYAEIPESLTALAADGYILVVQNIRGRFKSEGVFSLSEDVKLEPGKGTIETRDAWCRFQYSLSFISASMSSKSGLSRSRSLSRRQKQILLFSLQHSAPRIATLTVDKKTDRDNHY